MRKSSKNGAKNQKKVIILGEVCIVVLGSKDIETRFSEVKTIAQWAYF